MYYHRKPDVKITESIHNTRSDHRVRTTLGHEFGHVWIHAPLWREVGAKMKAASGPVWDCHRDTILDAPEYDWAEWQAGWVSGAILMPASSLRGWAAEYAATFGKSPPFALKSPVASALIKRVVEECDVSILAAHVRLSKLRLLVE